MRRFINRHKDFWSQKELAWSGSLSIVLLLASLVVNYFANLYTVSHAGNYVSDILLDNLPVFNVEVFFYEGFFSFWLFVILLTLSRPRRIPFVGKSIALFIVIRSLFIMLTHLGMPPQHSYLDPNDIFRFTTLGNDMFFSSHSGLPFLLALEFWDVRSLRLFFLFSSTFFASVVLLGHLHYSIDVFAAFFITYAIFHMARRLFPKDYCQFTKDNLCIAGGKDESI